jgi:hypothetical protein
LFKYVDDPQLFEFNEAIRDFKHPGGIEVKPVPEDYPVDEEMFEQKDCYNLIDAVDDNYYSIEDNERKISKSSKIKRVKVNLDDVDMKSQQSTHSTRTANTPLSSSERIKKYKTSWYQMLNV